MASKATAADIKFEIQKSDGKINFSLWQRRMKNILIQQGIKVALLGKEKQPEKMDADEWADIDERAMSSIEQYFSDKVMFNVMEEKSAKDLWEKLEKLYMGKILTNKLHLKKHLYGLKMEEGCDLMEHTNTFNKIISNLLRLDVKFDDEDRSLLFLNSLSDSYEHFMTTLFYGKETLNFEEVTQDIISNAARRKPSKGDSHAEGLLVKEGSHNLADPRTGVGQEETTPDQSLRARKI
ncbi:hypothetical protein MRB53_028248 [Persea americana]|uniref:Uncharacterized protein n=1 Tax=Persea americana TaxID=3435 RepID=A0ACC2KEZ9_PERAE|nr:hypothetical protein MRB53_028248 [Persea americana]